MPNEGFKKITELSSPVVLITGAAQRIGRDLALSFADRGWDVAVHFYHSGDKAVLLCAEIEKKGQRCCLIRADLRNEVDVVTIMKQATMALGPVSLLINNASGFSYDCVASVTKKSWDEHLSANLRAPFVLIQEFIKQTKTGSVINILDQRVWNLTPHFMSYTVSKAGLWTLTQTLALALAPHIRVNAIGPGPTLPNQRQTPEQFIQQYQKTPLQKAIDVGDICAAAHFLAKTSSITGQMIAVDGGQHLGWAFPHDRKITSLLPDDE